MKKLLFTILLFLSVSSLSWSRVVVSYPSNQLIYLGPFTYPHSNNDGQSVDLDFDGTPDIFLYRKFSTILYQKLSCPNGGRFNQYDRLVTFDLSFPTGKVSSNGLVSGNILLGTSNTQYSLPGFIGGGSQRYSEPEMGSIPTPNCLLPPTDWYISGLINNIGYLGFKWVKNGVTYYGYIYFRDQQIHSVAYENIPGYPITTGDTRGYFGSTASTANTIRGFLFNDSNKNCIKDPAEAGIPNTLVYTTNAPFISYTDQNGNYELVVDGLSSYTVSVDTTTTIGYLKNTCPNNSSITVNFTGNNQTVQNRNFALNATSCAKLSIAISSDRRRRCFKNTTTVTYQNKGPESVSNATVKVVFPSQVKPISSVPAWSSRNGDTLLYNFTLLTSYYSGKITIQDSVICGDETIRGLNVCTKAFISPASYCIPTNWDQSDLVLTGACTDGNFNVSIKNTGNGDMQDSLYYRVFMDNELIKKSKYKLKSGQTLPFDILVSGKAIRVEADQNQYHPELNYRAVFFEGCGADIISKGILNNYPIVPSGIGQSISCMTIIDSYDPNDKLASPEGFGVNSHIEKNTDLTYTIRFQNTGSDTAYTVVITDILDANLDYSSIETIGSSHPYKFEITGKDNARLAWIFGGINLVHKSQNEPGSHGYVTFRVSQKPNLADGTKITNKASIYFDYNSPIITNLVSREIGKPYVENLFTLNSYTTPKDTLCVNDDAAFSVNATGAGLTYQWLKNDEEIAGANLPQLALTGLNTDASASYQCRISSATKDVLYTSLKKLEVSSAPSVSSTPATASHCTGEQVTLALNTTLPKLTYQWYKDSDKLSGETSSSISLSAVAAKESGKYYCKITNLCGTTNVLHTNLNVNNYPSLAIVSGSELQKCSPQTIDITQIFDDLNNTSGIVKYWADENIATILVKPEAISQSGTYYITKNSEGCADTIAVNTKIETCSALNDDIWPGQIKLFPNPVLDFLSIESPENSSSFVEIRDITGRVVFQENFIGSKQIDFSAWNNGIYHLQLSQGTHINNYKIQKH